MSDRWGRIPDAVSHSHVSRAKLYSLAAKHKGLFRKLDSITIVDLVMLDEILDELPPAEIGSEPTTLTLAASKQSFVITDEALAYSAIPDRNADPMRCSRPPLIVFDRRQPFNPR